MAMGEGLRVLTVRQPWAWAIIHAGKGVENRAWSTGYRGLLAIHAGMKLEPAGAAWLARLGITAPGELTVGAIIGLVDLVDCSRGRSDDWAMPGMWHWRLANPRPLVEPVVCRGRQGLFVASAAIADDVLHAAGEVA